MYLLRQLIDLRLHSLNSLTQLALIQEHVPNMIEHRSYLTKHGVDLLSSCSLSVHSFISCFECWGAFALPLAYLRIQLSTLKPSPTWRRCFFLVFISFLP